MILNDLSVIHGELSMFTSLLFLIFLLASHLVLKPPPVPRIHASITHPVLSLRDFL